MQTPVDTLSPVQTSLWRHCMERLETMCMWLHVLIKLRVLGEMACILPTVSHIIMVLLAIYIPEWGQCPNWDCEMHGSLF